MPATKKRKYTRKPKADEPAESRVTGPGQAMNEALAEEMGTDLQSVARDLGFREESLESIDLDDLARRVAAVLQAQEPASGRAVVAERALRRIRYDYCDIDDPSKHVRLVREREKNVQHAKSQGYQPVDPATVVDRDHQRSWVGADNLVHFGDRIAMACPKELEEARARELREESMVQPTLVEAANEEAAAADGRPGGGLHKYEEHGHQKGRRVFPMS